MQEKRLALDSEMLQFLVKEKKSMLRMLAIVGRYGEGGGISTRLLLKELKANGLLQALTGCAKAWVHSPRRGQKAERAEGQLSNVQSLDEKRGANSQDRKRTGSSSIILRPILFFVCVSIHL